MRSRVAAVLVASAMTLALGSAAIPAQAGTTRNGCSAAEYQKLTGGMSTTRVERVVGFEGKLVWYNSSLGYYEYRCAQGTRNPRCFVTFSGGELMHKSRYRMNEGEPVG